MKSYQLVTYQEYTRARDIDREFEARNDREANAYAKREAKGTLWEEDWYVLDSQGRNING